MAPALRKKAISGRIEGNGALLVLGVLLVVVFFLGGGSRGDIASLIILRPVAVLCLAIGLTWMTPGVWRQFRLPLALMGALAGLNILQLVPLPPVVWMALPGRDIASEASRLVGAEDVWRPLALVPYRAWNSFYALLVPAAVLVLAAQLRNKQHHHLLRILIVLIALSGLLGFAQAASGYSPSLFLYRVTNLANPVGLFANKNHQAAALCILLPMLALIGSRTRASAMSVGRAAAFGAALVVITLILTTGSRAGVAFAFLALGGCWLVIAGRPRRLAGRVHKKSYAAPAALAAAAIFACGSLAFIFSRATALDRLASSDPVEEGRFEVWRVVADFLPVYQPFGAGFGSFVEVFQVHEPSALLATKYWNHAHNDWLEWLLDGGLPVAVLVGIALAALARAILGLRKELNSGGESAQLAVVGAAVLIILLLWSLVDYPLRTPILASLAAIASIWIVRAKDVALSENDR